MTDSTSGGIPAEEFFNPQLVVSSNANAKVIVLLLLLPLLPAACFTPLSRALAPLDMTN
jgi:hypothetical protein